MKRTIRDLKNIKGKRVLLRCDFNVPLDEYGDIVDTTRIDEAMPTINYLLEQGCKLIICSHLGRPKGFDKFLSLFPVAVYLMKLLPNRVKFSHKVIGPEVTNMVKELKDGHVLLLENTRFDPREEQNDPKFVEELASLADIFVDDAFGTAHRKHASNYGVALKLPSAIGFLIEKELRAFEDAFEHAKHPFIAVFGGAKVKDKLPLISNVIGKADSILIGGGMAYTFLLAQGINIGNSIVDLELVEEAKRILKLAEEKHTEILLPIDHVALVDEKKVKTVALLEAGMVGYDIGPKTIAMFLERINHAGQIIWNGPLGKFEDSRFEKGTLKIAKAVAKNYAYSIVGGGDSISAVNKIGCGKYVNHLSTGGGASLKLMEGKTLPAIEVIDTL